ncbi:hypothetical protein Trco_003581 [Trichoderma cornu-damae]|uniref:CFEM domain-containing protein n=1 Tax=Trichoderma cornu-damae TaxID=654480 RepID=A0A9P8TWA6_9HYPO|nr:hypothetical protein Trco_003581 [Trichoderma cornu-damae]
MKTAAFALLAAAGVEQVAATYSLGAAWTQAKPYSCPGNTNNNCNTQQNSGWDFSDVPTGDVGSYGGFHFSGWSCENDFGKRDSLLSARAFGSTGRSIVGSCTADKETTPCISAGAGTGHFSVDTFSLSTEFDTRLEFHYEMPDGSTCKHSAHCSSQGTTVKNSQCGGAKKVSIVYPGGGESTCKTKVHHVSWDCGSNAPPPPSQSQPAYTPPPSGGSPHHSFSSPGDMVPPYSQPGETYTAPPAQTMTAPPAQTMTAPAQTTTAPAPAGTDTETTTGTAAAETTTGTAPAGAETTTAPSETYTAPAGAETTTAPGFETYTAPAGVTTTGQAAAETTTAPGETGPATTLNGGSPPAEATTTAEVETTPANTDVAVSTSIITAPSDTSSAGAETTTAPAGETTTVPAGGAETTTAAATTGTAPAPAGETQTAPVGESTAAAGTTTAAGSETTTAPAASQSVYTTVFQSTSTVFTTSVHTITSCAPNVTNCPARIDKPVLTTVTVAVSTTVCPVTAIVTAGPGPQQTSSEAAAATEAPSATGSRPAESGLPCPDVLPKCINTWMSLVSDCKDNTDASCYCPSRDLVQKVFDCIYSNGESDDDVSAAIVFFQGVCAAYAASNPAVATGAATITSIITVTGTPLAAAPTDYTTVVVATTVTEPYVSNGVTVPSSSTTVFVSTAITVPQVSITAAPVTAVPTLAPPAETAPGAAPTLVTPPAGTGTGTPSTPVNTGIPVINGAGRLGASLGLGFAVMAAVVAL